ncbi:MAG: ATP-dependent DNA helicase RecG [Pseudomonadota bacterium]
MSERGQTAAPDLKAPLTELSGVGPALADKLADADLHSVEDLLFHLPLRFEDRTQVTPIGALRPGRAALVAGEIALAETVFRPRRSFLARISDGTGSLTMRLFHFSNTQVRQLTRGTRLSMFGDTRMGPAGLEMVHPEYRHLAGDAAPTLERALTPVYPAADGIGQKRLRSLTAQALAALSRDAPAELLPDEIVTELGLPPLADALRELHHPQPGFAVDPDAGVDDPSIRRLALEEILAQHLSLRRLRLRSERFAAPPIPAGTLADTFVDALPFALTGAQRRVAGEIAADLTKPTPMQRLVQGDVGSGKTIVAAMAALQAIDAGLQTALMAPTEILSDQHRATFDGWLAPLGRRVVQLKSRQKSAERRAAVAAVADGSADLVVGTHALFQEGVAFHKLGLAIIDEQHRFGVAQRLALTQKSATDGERAHQLVMTATPIPRTLAMTAYADLDTSVVDELPPGRTPVTTAVIPDTRRDELTSRVREACLEGRQVYWVCPLIEESETLNAEAATSRYEELRAQLPEVRVGLVHGRLAATDKHAVMAAFKAGEIALLVATTVIEVGVDVPNASLMIIENAERLGLAQLHQLRGRVGRGAAQSSCLLLYRTPLSRLAKERLKVMRETNDGFIVAEKDLELRGPGEVLGTRQTGAIQFRIADLSRDRSLLPVVRRAATLIEQTAPGNADRLIERWLGSAERFATV